eukprot:5782930-Alexandrium_andersonii.AAC.1
MIRWRWLWLQRLCDHSKQPVGDEGRRREGAMATGGQELGVFEQSHGRPREDQGALNALS